MRTSYLKLTFNSKLEKAHLYAKLTYAFIGLGCPEPAVGMYTHTHQSCEGHKLIPSVSNSMLMKLQSDLAVCLHQDVHQGGPQGRLNNGRKPGALPTIQSSESLRGMDQQDAHLRLVS
jgi:hypothetical protein